MKLYIAEKPSLGRAIADALPRPHQRQDGFIRAANGDCVSGCIGHLLELAEPHQYDPSLKQWRLDQLPIVPEQWQLQAKSQTKKQLSVLRKLVKQADQLIHAGDPDREGQLLVDQVIDHLGVSQRKKQQTQRCLINDLNPSAVQRSLNNLKDNRQFIPLSTSALARSRADWLYGINMTRAYTLQGQKAGYQGVLSVGRVQTPILGLVVQRDREIERFVSKPFYEVRAHLITENGETFGADWVPSEACAPHQDSDGRVINKTLAEHVVRRIHDQPAKVRSIEKKDRSQAAPLPYNLSSLQIDAAKRYHLNAKQVLDTCQSLYEKHKLITYPRSDCRYLPSEHHRQATQVLNAIKHTAPTLQMFVQQANSQQKNKAWNDKKVDAHHAIIPTQAKADGQKLSRQENQVYDLIARQYIAQFLPNFEFTEQKAHIEIAGGLFRANARTIHQQGWKTVLQFSKSRSNPPASQATLTDQGAEQNNQPALLPPLRKDQDLHCQHGELLEKTTQPPKAFTDATLLAAMTGIARFVSDPDIRKILKDTDGLGTEATRAGIIELLFKRDFLSRQNKAIHATETGKALVDSLPEVAVKPDMTARWEASLNAISERQASYQDFMQPMLAVLAELISNSKASPASSLQRIRGQKTPAKHRRPSNANKTRRRAKNQTKSFKK